MARLFDVSAHTETIRKSLARSLQSGRINFLIGSGASLPAIPAAGLVEQEIAALIAAEELDEARTKTYEFLSAIQGPTNALILSTSK